MGVDVVSKFNCINACVHCMHLELVQACTCTCTCKIVHTTEYCNMLLILHIISNFTLQMYLKDVQNYV